MNIAIDIDDTLTDSFAHFQPAVAAFFGVSLREVRKMGVSHCNLPPEWQAQNDAFSARYYEIYAPSTPFKPDAKAAVDELRREGHRIVILTGRDSRMYRDPYETTRVELANGGIVYDELLCRTDKGRACREEGIGLLIDDVPANCDLARREGIPALLFDSPANRDAVTDLPRARSWKEALEFIRGMRK